MPFVLTGPKTPLAQIFHSFSVAQTSKVCHFGSGGLHKSITTGLYLSRLLKEGCFRKTTLENIGFFAWFSSESDFLTPT